MTGLVPDNTVFDPPGDPDPDPQDLYNSSMMIRGALSTSICGNSIIEDGETCDPPGSECSSICQTIVADVEPCPWDCQVNPSGAVGIEDFLRLLAQWTQIDVDCDFGEGPPGVGVEDFLKLLEKWGPCP